MANFFIYNFDKADDFLLNKEVFYRQLLYGKILAACVSIFAL